MKIRFRLILFLLFLTLIFLILFIFYGIYEQKRITSLSNAVQLEKEFVFDRILEIQGKSLKTFSYDYSYWDDMVKFVTSPDKKWAAEHIDVSLDTYAANAAWVYNLDWQLVYSVNNLKQDDLLKELPIPKDAFGSLFKHLPSCHFFVNTPAGLMEFWGATIQSSVDLQRKELAKGYFFTSRLWGQSYINELSRITDSSVILSDTENIPIRLKKDAIEFSRIIIGGDNHPVEYITVTSTSQAVREVRKSLIQIAVLFISFFVTIFLVVVFFITYWVNLPLELMSLALKKGDTSLLSKIKKQGSEFSELSEMISNFFMQRKEILREVSERRQVQDALTKANQCFASFVNDPDKNIQLITKTAGEILGATCMLYNRMRDGILVTEASWNEPPDFSRSDLGKDGHLCFDAIKNQSNQLVVIEDLQATGYAQTDPNVKKYDLRSYVSYPVRVSGRTIASFCAAFSSVVKIDEYHLDLLQVLGKAASIEEERKLADEVFKDQTLKLDNTLKETLKSREVLLSMLEDNHLNKEKLEQSVAELALAYSKLKESQQEVIQSAKFGAIGQLASSVAHEVRNPLAIIMQSIEYLGNKVSAEHQEIIQLATNNIKRANSIVGTLLDFSKAKELNMEPEDINLILNDALVLTRYSNVEDKVKVVKEFGRDLPKVLVDRQKMEQVFVNIFLNAMQAMSGEGNIFVRTYLVEFNNLPEEAKRAINDPVIKQAVIIEIQDEGVGIPEENMKNVFRPFFTTKGAMMGIGLGLSVVKDIITMHEGYIEIKSQLNKGTKVILTLRAITE